MSISSINIEESAAQKEQELFEWLSKYQSSIVAYSGGVDSTYVLFAANKIHGERALGVSSFSETVPQIQKDYALENVRIIGSKYEIIQTQEMQKEQFVENKTDRCFHCKDELYGVLSKIAEDRDFDIVVDGTNADDLGDFRPGRKAADLHKVKSPLVEIGMTKEEIRIRSRIAGLTTWNIPASACLSSRIPHNSLITLEKLKTVEEGEAFLRSLGFRQIRVRHHDKIVRIELAPDEMSRIWQQDLFQRITQFFKSLGFQFVTLDLEGYRTGSLNL
ncbi:MAG TPA: ATP-dependent sacrificial sulfur transferase LarE [Acidobacteriota bacterium]|nr:ATP-dependent sacrificial sulfur transferase LarE [Acidobacteriota bacterium]